MWGWAMERVQEAQASVLALGSGSASADPAYRLVRVRPSRSVMGRPSGTRRSRAVGATAMVRTRGEAIGNRTRARSPGRGSLRIDQMSGSATGSGRAARRQTHRVCRKEPLAGTRCRFEEARASTV